MPVPTAITELSRTASSNSPSGSDSPITTDDHIRALAAFIAQLRDKSFVSVNDYGAASTASAAANSTAFASCVSANPGKYIVFPDTSYNFDTKLAITADDTKLYFPNTTMVFTGTGDAIHFYCTSTATVSTYLNGCGLLGNLTVYRASADTTGAGVRLTQCNLFTYNNLRIDNFVGGLLQEGGQLITGDTFAEFKSVALYPSVVSGSYQAKVTTAPITGSLYQVPYSTTISKVRTGGSYSSEFGFLIEACDGFTAGSGYISGSFQSLVRLKPSVSGKSISGVSFGTCYLDGKNQSTGTENGVELLDDGFAGASMINNVDFSACHTIGNLQGIGVYSTHPNLQTIQIDRAAIVNVAGAEVDVASGDISFDSWIGVRLPWPTAPALTAATPGDLSVSYTTQLATWLRDRAGLVHVDIHLLTSAFTHTTASGELRISNAPTSAGSLIVRPQGTLQVNGFTKAGYTNFTSEIGSGSTYLTTVGSGSGVSFATLAVTDFPTGGTVLLRASLSYPVSELG